MGGTQHCDQHGYVDATEMRWYGDVEVHMVGRWHSALRARPIEMKGGEPVLDAVGNPVFAGTSFEPAVDMPPDDAGGIA
jgi:hypothetical protein